MTVAVTRSSGHHRGTSLNAKQKRMDRKGFLHN